jgi:hypothetical protein
MRNHLTLGSAVRCSVAAAALAAALALTPNAQAASKPAVSMSKVAGSYKIALVIGAAETMSMNMHGHASERMIGGKNVTCSMSMQMEAMVVGAASMPMCNHHVEVHVHNKSNGKVITNAAVTIVLQSNGMHGASMMIRVPIMTMEGMNAGSSDFHYGNNINAAAGKYTVHVTVNRVKADFSVSLTGGM